MLKIALVNTITGFFVFFGAVKLVESIFFSEHRLDTTSTINRVLAAEAGHYSTIENRRKDYKRCRVELFDFIKGKPFTPYKRRFATGAYLSLQPGSSLTFATETWRKGLPDKAIYFYVYHCNPWGTWSTAYYDWTDYLVVACDQSDNAYDWILVPRLPSE